MRSTWGSIRKRGEAWELRYPVAGKPKTETVRGTRKDAERRLAELRIEYEGAQPDMTLSQFWDTYYYPEIKDRLAQTTVDGYMSYWNTSIRPAFGDMALNDINPRMVQDWLSSMTKGKAAHHKRALSAILSRAFSLGLVDDNVADRRFALPHEYTDRRRTKEIYTFEELNEIYELCRDEFWEPAFILAAFGGATRCEACSPLLEEVELTDDGFVVIPIKRGVHRIDGEVVIENHAKNAYRQSEIVIPPPYSHRLMEIVNEGIGRGDKWLLDDGFGEPVNPEIMSKAYKRWFQRNPLKYLPFANLRNAYSTYLHNRFSIEQAQVSKLMRHSKYETDYTHYNRPSVADKIEALKVMGSYGQKREDS